MTLQLLECARYHSRSDLLRSFDGSDVRVPSRSAFAALTVLLSVALLGLLNAACTASAAHGPLGFVTNERDGTLTVFDAEKDEQLKTIEVGGRPRGVRIGPDGKTVYVAVSTPTAATGRKSTYTGEERIVAVDPEQGNVIASYKVGTDPEQFALSPDGKRLFISNEDAGTASITDLAANNVIATHVVGLEPEGVTISPDGRWVYITSESSSTIAVIDTSNNQLVKTFMVGARPRDTAFSPDGTRAYVSAENGGNVSVIDVASHSVIATIDLPRGNVRPMGVAVSPDGKHVYVATGRGNSVAVIDTTNNTVSAMIPVGNRPWGIAISPDGKRLYTANGISNDISIISTAKNEVVATLKAGDGPWGIALAPASSNQNQ